MVSNICLRIFRAAEEQKRVVAVLFGIMVETFYYLGEIWIVRSWIIETNSRLPNVAYYHMTHIYIDFFYPRSYPRSLLIIIDSINQDQWGGSFGSQLLIIIEHTLIRFTELLVMMASLVINQQIEVSRYLPRK